MTDSASTGGRRPRWRLCGPRPPSVRTSSNWCGIGQGDLQKSITDVNDMVAQGINALVIIPDFGKAQLALDQGGNRCRREGGSLGRRSGRRTRQGLCDLCRLGRARHWPGAGRSGSRRRSTTKATSSFSAGLRATRSAPRRSRALHARLKDHPNINLVTGYKDWAVTNWDPAQTQKVLSALLAKYPNIAAVIDDAGGDASASVFRTYEAAGRPMVPLGYFRRQRAGLRIREAQAEQRRPRTGDHLRPQLDGTHRGAQGDRGRAGPAGE